MISISQYLPRVYGYALLCLGGCLDTDMHMHGLETLYRSEIQHELLVRVRITGQRSFGVTWMGLRKAGVLRKELRQQNSQMRILLNRPCSHLRWLRHVDRASEDRLQNKTYMHQEEWRRTETALSETIKKRGWHGRDQGQGRVTYMVTDGGRAPRNRGSAHVWVED